MSQPEHLILVNYSLNIYHYTKGFVCFFEFHPNNDHWSVGGMSLKRKLRLDRGSSLTKSTSKLWLRCSRHET